MARDKDLVGADQDLGVYEEPEAEAEAQPEAKKADKSVPEGVTYED